MHVYVFAIDTACSPRIKKIVIKIIHYCPSKIITYPSLKLPFSSAYWDTSPEVPTTGIHEVVVVDVSFLLEVPMIPPSLVGEAQCATLSALIVTTTITVLEVIEIVDSINVGVALVAGPLSRKGNKKNARVVLFNSLNEDDEDEEEAKAYGKMKAIVKDLVQGNKKDVSELRSHLVTKNVEMGDQSRGDKLMLIEERPQRTTAIEPGQYDISLKEYDEWSALAEIKFTLEAAFLPF
ncbi:hypothetical protein ACFE04_001863 [Oxalis oulophora]